MDDRPPVATDIAPSPGAAGRVSSQRRIRIAPRFWPDRLEGGIDPAHLYVRTYWTAALGQSVVVDLLRLISAARRRRAIPHPLFLPVLCREDLVRYAERTVWVRDLVPPLGRRHLARLSPVLRQRHQRDLALARREAPSPPPSVEDVSGLRRQPPVTGN